MLLHRGAVSVCDKLIVIKGKNTFEAGGPKSEACLKYANTLLTLHVDKCYFCAKDQ